MYFVNLVTQKIVNCRCRQHQKPGKELHRSSLILGIFRYVLVRWTENTSLSGRRHTQAHTTTYKHTFSIVLLALVDANYKFLFVDIGTNGRVSDGGVFRNSALSQALEANSLNLPNPQKLYQAAHFQFLI